MSPLLFAIASTLLRVWSALARPTSATCPPRWWLSEVWAEGRYVCSMPVRSDEDTETRGVEGRIYCEGRAVQVGDGRSIRCERSNT